MDFTLWRWPFWQKKPEPRMTAEEVMRLVREKCHPGDTVLQPGYWAKKRQWRVAVITQDTFEGREFLMLENVRVYDETGEVAFWESERD